MKRKTVVITVVIAAVVLVFGFVSLLVIASMLGDSGTAFSGFGPKVAIVELYGQIYSSPTLTPHSLFVFLISKVKRNEND